MMLNNLIKLFLIITIIFLILYLLKKLLRHQEKFDNGVYKKIERLIDELNKLNRSESSGSSASTFPVLSKIIIK